MTTRQGGVSQSPYDTFNLGDHVGDDPHAVIANRRLLAVQLGVRPVFLQQIHGISCIEIDRHTPDGMVADGVVTRDSGVACAIMVADCLPVLFWGKSMRAVGAAHAGWRGLVGSDGDSGKSNILQMTVEKLRHLLGPQETIHAWLGPCIGFEAFEVGEEVARHFEARFKQTLNNNKWRVDLVGAARQVLQQLGVTSLEGNDGAPHWCTVQNERDYFSHRRATKQNHATGRMAACIWPLEIDGNRWK